MSKAQKGTGNDWRPSMQNPGKQVNTEPKKFAPIRFGLKSNWRGLLNNF